MKKLYTLTLIALVFCLGISQLHAQSFASITGTVTDQTGAVVSNVSIVLENSGTGDEYKATTNSEGSYTISNVKPGPGYQITFKGEGFNPLVITGLYLNVNATRTQNGKLVVGGGQQSVTVSAATEAITINITDATVGNNFEVQDLNNLPVQFRDSPSALFTQQPGVTLDGSVTGSRTDQSNVTLDGLDVNDLATGNFGAIVGSAPVDSVQEFRGVSASPLSSAGEGGGGQYELVTRSGSNAFHGALVEYHRDTALEANDWFNNNSTPKVARPPLIRNQFGGNIGGPIKRDKAFFFFDWNSRRDTISTLVRRTVPTDALRNGTIAYTNDTGGVSTLSSAQIAALDPIHAGFNSALLSVITGRYPEPNDFSRGDGINYAGFNFNAPAPRVQNDYVGRIDFDLTSTQKLWGRVTFARTTDTQSPIQFPGDPLTWPFQDKSRAWVVGHTWTIGNNKINQASFGETVANYNFPNTFNKTGENQFTMGGLPSGGNFLSGAYSNAVNAQGREYPVPVIRDDFSWTKGRHSLSFGGSFKYLNPTGYTILDYNFPTIGLGGHLSTLNAGLRPADLSTDATDIADYDAVFTYALGRYQSINSTFNYDAGGNLVPQGTGSRSHYRYYETEIYAGDSWKITPSLTMTYGLRWQNYTVPYEVNGIESVPDTDFYTLLNARIAQSAAGAQGPSTDCSTASLGVPCVSYLLGGKANNGPGYFNPQNHNFAPRVAFAWALDPNRKTVLSAGAGVVYDHTIVNAIQYQASQYSYLFQAEANEAFGITGNPVASLATDPRFGGFDNPPAPPTAPAALSAPYTPYVDGGIPFGLSNGQAFNEGVDKNLKTPYNVQLTLGLQHEFRGGFLLKTNYVGRLGRRLVAQADANQLIEFVDKQSGQSMSEAFGNVATWMRQNPTADPSSVPAQPWFENEGAAVGIYAPGDFGVPTYTSIITNYLGTLAYRGDFADTIQALSSVPLIPDNVGMGSQFSEFTYYTNKGISNYHGLLVTLHKNMRSGLSFDMNYTWSHSIDNTSYIANAIALGGYGFICDVMRPQLCRGNSDFDVKHYLNGNFLWEIPVGRGKQFGSNTPIWVEEVVGGWSLSGLPSWHTGEAWWANSNAFVAGYANSAPAILVGPKSDLKMNIHKDANNTLWAFKNEDATINDFTGPVGFQIGSRNSFRGPAYFNLDLGLGKNFPVYKEKVNLKFRADAFNALNHPNFSAPSFSDGNADITETQQGFGVLVSTANSARVLQLALRLEF
ncbi:MAG: carboxypeptidase regulatory-like domain-containing protein [Acidobacteria bacterium]|nr:carboxypeptidase regulatory-like domain-containing protein [Acidobacteriota bacterium]